MPDPTRVRVRVRDRTKPGLPVTPPITVLTVPDQTANGPAPDTPATNRSAPWQVLGLTPAMEEYARLRVARPELSGIACVKLIAAYAGRSKSAQSNVSHNLMKRPEIQQRIAQLEREAVVAVERRRRHKLSAKRVLAELSNVAFADVRSLLEVTSDQMVIVKPSAEWPDRVAAAVASVTPTEGGVKIQLHEKLGALRSLAKILKMVPDDRQPGVVIGRAVVYIPSNNRPMLRPGENPDDVLANANPEQEESQ